MQLYINFSNTLHKIGVSDIGLKSVLILWGLDILLTGITVADFQILGMNPSLIDALKIEVTGPPVLYVWCISFAL